MGHRVLDQRKQQQWRKRQLAEFRGQLDGHGKSRTQAQGHDIEVAPTQLELIRQRGGRRGPLVAHARQGRAQVLCQRLHELLRAPRVGLDFGADRGERVEQEVRLDLRLQHRQPRLGREFLLPQGIEFPPRGVRPPAPRLIEVGTQRERAVADGMHRQCGDQIGEVLEHRVHRPAA